jgi:tetratricopeptide (TPR) repeat protein
MTTTARLTVCLALTAALASAGCGKKLPPGQALWEETNARYGALVEHPEQAGAEDVEAAIEAFERVERAGRGRRAGAQALEAIGRIHLGRGNHDLARTAFQRITWDYANIRDVGAMALIYLGRSYAAQGRWDEATKTYHEIETRYPWTDIWLEVPLYVIWLQERRNDRDALQAAYRAAVSRYHQRVAEAPDAAWGAKARGYLALVYRKMGRPDDEARVLKELAVIEHQASRPDVLLALGFVYGRLLDDPGHARTLYTRTVDEFGDDPLAALAADELSKLTPAL